MYRHFKRLIDLVGALVILLLISPLYIILAILVRINLGSPILFKQQRTGLRAKNFYIMKFRTMSDKRDAEGNLLPDHFRVSKLGVFLRSSSLDELPELFNIIKGDMSFIGPRPLPSSYNPYYTEKERKRFDVRGGLVPPDSIDPNPIISWDKQFEYEPSYAENLSLWLDINIVINAFRIVFQRNNSDYGSFERKALYEERKDMKK